MLGEWTFPAAAHPGAAAEPARVGVLLPTLAHDADAPKPLDVLLFSWFTLQWWLEEE